MIPFQDLKPLYRSLEGEIQAAVNCVLASGWYILGPEVEAFEQELSVYLGGATIVAVASGTDAVELALRAAGIGPGDEVITVSHTAVATVCAIERSGATPVLVDVERATMTMSPEAAAAAITPRTRAIVPVHLYGHPARIDELQELADRHGLILLEDAAQALGARWLDRPVATWGQMAALSFYPTKTVAALGDAGAVVCQDPAMADKVRRLRCYGQSSRDVAEESGTNSRMDELQAAILRIKLRHADEHLQLRRGLAATYDRSLPRTLELPVADTRALHALHLYVVRHSDRDQLQRSLHESDIGTLVHYRVPVHRQPAYLRLGYSLGSLPETESASDEVLSLPLYVGLSAEQIGRVAEVVRRSLMGVET